MSKKNWDEADYIAHAEKLTSDLAILETQLRSEGKTFDARPQLPKTDMVHACELLQAHIAKLFTLTNLNTALGTGDLASYFKKLTVEAYTLELTLKAAGIPIAQQRNRPDQAEFDSDELVACKSAERYLVGLKAQVKAIPAKISPPAPSVSTASAKAVSGIGSPAGISPSTPPQKVSLTDRILKARGVSSLAELEARRSKPAAKAATPNTASASAPKEKVPSLTERVLAAKGVSSLAELAARGGKAALVILAALLSIASVKAQDAKAYTLLSGGTNSISAATTNAPIYLNVSDFNEFALQAMCRGVSSGGSNVLFQIYRTIDSDVQESSPFAVFSVRLTGTETNTAVFPLDVGSAASVRIIAINTNGVPITNITLKARFKAPKKKTAL